MKSKFDKMNEAIEAEKSARFAEEHRKKFAEKADSLRIGLAKSLARDTVVQRAETCYHDVMNVLLKYDAVTREAVLRLIIEKVMSK